MKGTRKGWQRMYSSANDCSYPYILLRWPDCSAKWEKAFGVKFLWHAAECNQSVIHGPTPGLFVCRSQLIPFLLMLVWVGFSVTFSRRNHISGFETSFLLSRHIALAHICETRRVTAVPLRERRWHSLHMAEEHHPGLQRNSKARGENGRQWEAAKSSLTGSRKFVPVLERS